MNGSIPWRRSKPRYLKANNTIVNWRKKRRLKPNWSVATVESEKTPPSWSMASLSARSPWAAPTGKLYPPSLAKTPVSPKSRREKRAPIVNQDDCQVCSDGGEIVLCSGCPRSYHMDCLDPQAQAKAHGKMQFHCPQHECVDCSAKTTDAGGLIYRCRWCAYGYCEECLDFDKTVLIGATLPELMILGFGASDQAWFIECPSCVSSWETNKTEKKRIDKLRVGRQREYDDFLAAVEDEEVVAVEPPTVYAEKPLTSNEMGLVGVPVGHGNPDFALSTVAAQKPFSYNTGLITGLMEDDDELIEIERTEFFSQSSFPDKGLSLAANEMDDKVTEVKRRKTPKQRPFSLNGMAFSAGLNGLDDYALADADVTPATTSEAVTPVNEPEPRSTVKSWISDFF